MKASFALLALLISFLCFAQEPDHFNNNSSMWYVAKTYPNATPQYPAFAETKTTVFRLPADTMINGSLWFKVIGSDDSLSLVNPVLKGFIQSNGDTVLYRTPGGQVVILYNFNLSIGDSVLYDFGYFSSCVYNFLIN